MTEQPLKILFLAAEAVPFAKVGGLADVAGSLPQAIRALGHDVRLMMPRYGTIRSDQFQLETLGEPFPVPVGPGEEHVHLIGSTLNDDIPVYLIWNELYFSSRDRVYGFEDDAQRFAVFGRASLAALRLLDWKPDVIHANDWHTGIVPVWLNTAGRRDRFYGDIATLFTIHNLAFQGIAGRLILTFAQMEFVKHLSVEQPGMVNWMAQGIAHADLINTVSERYAQEILTEEMGMGENDGTGSLVCSTGLTTKSGTRPQTPTSPTASTPVRSIGGWPTRPPCSSRPAFPCDPRCLWSGWSRGSTRSKVWT
jgi:starch synthase